MIDQLVEAVKAHAQEHYEDGGWDVVVECFTDAEIADFLLREDPVPTSPEEAIAAFQSTVEVWAERQADAINSAF